MFIFDWFLSAIRMKVLLGKQHNSRLQKYKFFLINLIEFAFKYNNKEAFVRIYCIKSAYYGAQWQSNPSAAELIDSVAFYEQKAIEAYEEIAHPSGDLSETIAYSYYNMAVSLLEKGDPISLEKALEFIEKALHQAFLFDNYMQLSYHDLRGNVFLKQGKLKQAEEEARLQLEILSNYLETNGFLIEFREMYRKNIKLSTKK